MQPRKQHQIDLCGTPSAALYEFVPEGLDPEAPNGPFHPALVSQMQPVDARRLARDRSSRIFANYHELRNILDRHEATIQKRWAKKSKTQRKAILLKAWPNSK